MARGGKAAALDAPERRSVSLIAACRDRTSFLLKALPSWRKALSLMDEIIVVDWSTSSDMLQVSELDVVGKDDRITVIKVVGQDDWVLSRAYNLASKFAGNQLLLKVDCDTMLEQGFLAAHPLNESSVYYRTFWRLARDENERHLNGVFYMPRSLFEDVQGYDERLVTYGWDDTDLFSRLEREARAISRTFQYDRLHHIRHDDETRAANQVDVSNPMVQTQMNSLMIQRVPHWKYVAKEEMTTYLLKAQSADMKVLEASVVRLSQSGYKQLSLDEYLEVKRVAEERVAHDSYGIPWDVIKELVVPLAEVLQDIRFSSSSDSRETRLLFVELCCSAGDVLRGLNFALSLGVESFPIIFVSVAPSSAFSFCNPSAQGSYLSSSL